MDNIFILLLGRILFFPIMLLVFICGNFIQKSNNNNACSNNNFSYPKMARYVQIFGSRRLQKQAMSSRNALKNFQLLIIC
jgi:hypothetical protein